jgi:hypothetical protein
LSVTVQASKHPLKPDWVYADVEAGQSIYEIAGGAPVAAYINGHEVPEEMHRLTRVKERANLVLWPVPQDDGILRSVALIAVAVFAPQIAAGLQLGATATKIATVGISLAGSMAVNALIPPQQPEQPNVAESFNRLNAITGTSNQVAAFQPIPRLYGTFRFFPSIPMTAKPFTEVVGNDQYLRMMVCLGYGPLEIGGTTVGEGYSKITEESSLSGAPIKIGETDINLFEQVEYEIGTPDQMTLYSDQIIQTDPAFTSQADDSEIDSDAEGQWITDGVSATRTTETDVDEISISVSGRLFNIGSTGNARESQVQWKIEYREVGSSNFQVVTDDWRIKSSRKETVREGYRFKVPKGQYEVRLTRVRTYHQNFEANSDEFTWNALRSIRSVQPFDVDDTVCMALRIKATDQLNGRLDNLSVLATSVLDVYNGSNWVRQATNNPAWVYADIWSGAANRSPIPLSGLDTAELLEWANYCDNNGLEYNGIFDNQGTTLERVREVAGAGLASWAFKPDSKISVIKEVVESVPRMVISPRNSFNFTYEVSAVEVPDALRVQFVDNNTWENTERLVFDDGFDESNAQKYETLQAKGVTDPDQAWKYGRYHLAQQRLRPERFTFKQDVQHLRYQRGDLLTIQYDTILVGLSAGRVVETISNTEIVLDETIFFEAGKSYGVKIQKSNGLVSTVGVANDFPSSNTLLLNSPITGISPDDMVVFGELGKESIDVKVTEIQPEGNFTATITCVPAAQNVLDALTGSIPQYDPEINEPIDADRVDPETPEIDDPSLEDGAIFAINITRDSDGSTLADLFVTVRTKSQFGQIQQNQLRYREVGTDQFVTLPQQSSNLFKIEDVNIGTTYEFQARGVKDNIFSPWSTPPVQYTVEDENGLASLTPTITNLTQSDVQLPPIGTVQSYILVEYQLGGGAEPSLIELRWEAPSVSPLTETYEPDAGIIRFPVNTYGETYSVTLRTRSVHGYWSEFSDPVTITPEDPEITNQDLIDFISNDISESQLSQDLNTRLDDYGLEITELEDQYTVKIDNNGGVAGFGLANTANNDTSSGSFSEFYVNADRFAILPQTTSTSGLVAPFIVQNNQVFIDDVLIADGSIDNAKIANAAISEAKIGTAEVSTLKIQGNAITVPQQEILVGEVDVDGFNKTILTANYFNNFNESVELIVIWSMRWRYDGAADVQNKKWAPKVFSSSSSGHAFDSPSETYGPWVSGSLEVTVGANSTEFVRLSADPVSGFTDGHVDEASIIFLGTKR